MGACVRRSNHFGMWFGSFFKKIKHIFIGSNPNVHYREMDKQMLHSYGSEVGRLRKERTDLLKELQLQYQMVKAAPGCSQLHTPHLSVSPPGAIHSNPLKML